jgi:putative membrane protein
MLAVCAFARSRQHRIKDEIHVKLGKLATQKASSEDGKKFGQKMVPGEMNAKDKATVNRMSALSGAAFDKAYVKDMVLDHKNDVAAVKDFAGKTLPTLQEHLKMIQDINSKL